MVDALKKSDVLNAVLANMDTRDLARFALTCKFNRASVRVELRRRICDVLASHIPRIAIPHFLNLLCDTDSIVSGSSALAVLSWNTRRDYRNWRSIRDLDIYVPLGCAQPFIDFFRALGYTPKFASIYRSTPYTRTNGVRAVATLMRLPDSIPLAPTTLDIIESTRRTAMWPLAHFWGTIVNNFISGRTLVSAYPTETLNGTCIVNPDADVFKNVLEKYRARGFKIVVRRPKIVNYLDAVGAAGGARTPLFLSHSSTYNDVFVRRYRPIARARGTSWRWLDWTV